MKRGEIWTVAGGPDYAGKPRPVVIVQDDAFSETRSVVICSFTTNQSEAVLFRIEIAPTPVNGLVHPSRLMVDKVASVPRGKLGRRLGVLGEDDMQRLSEALTIFLGLMATDP